MVIIIIIPHHRNNLTEPAMRRRNLCSTSAASPRHFCSTSVGFYDDVGGFSFGGGGGVLDGDNGDVGGLQITRW